MREILTPKQALFVQEYLVDLNATGAATRAGYAPDSAHVEGHRLLNNAKVAASIDEAMDARAERLSLSQDWVLNRFKKISDRCMQSVPVLDRRGKPVLIETENGEIAPAYTFDSAGANKATEMIGRHLSMFKEQVEHSGPNGGPMQIESVDRPPGETREQWIARRERELSLARAMLGSPAGSAD